MPFNALINNVMYLDTQMPLGIGHIFVGIRIDRNFASK
jgi:hypothetical protein